jgi:hypothetical protein
MIHQNKVQLLVGGLIFCFFWVLAAQPGGKDFARKLFIRYHANHANGLDDRAIVKTACDLTAPFIVLARVTNQSCDQFNVIPNLPGNESTSSRVAAWDTSCQSADSFDH